MPTRVRLACQASTRTLATGDFGESDYSENNPAGKTMTHSLEALRLSLLSRPVISSLGDPLLALGLWAMVGLSLSLLGFRYAPSRDRRNGTMGHY